MRKLKNINPRILLSVTALALIVVLAAGITFSWAEGGDKGYVNGNDIVISSGSNLTMRQDGKTTNSIIIPACTLEEVSSADGRNYFFPTADNVSSVTTLMKFREGTPADENTRYLSLDFELEAGDSATEVYLGAGTIVQCDNAAVMKALRMSFSCNDGSDPVVFKPTQMPGVEMKYSPITAITNDGTATTTETITSAYGDYYYKGANESESIFQLEKGETLNVTLSIWLEGTEFSGDDVANSNLSVYIDFTTTVDDLVKYNFVDNTHGYSSASSEYWVTNNMEKDNVKYATMMYLYDVDTDRYYAMEKIVEKVEGTSGAEWEIYVPNDIRNFYFRRYSIDIDQWWNQWEPDMSDIKTDPDGGHTFIAICGNTKDTEIENSGCYGYWQDENDTIRVYFKNNVGWDNLKCYAWRTDGSFATDKWKVGEPADDVGTNSWPGKILNYSHNDTDGIAVYYIDLSRASELVGIQFNNSANNAQYEITDKQYFYNGFATWYTSATSNGKWTYTGEANSLIYPVNDPTP